MSVTDFECAIAKSQIGRYIAGDNLAPEVARQLESHIDNCARCKQLLQEKKSSLEAMIGTNEDTEERTTIKVTNNPVVMTRPTATDGSSALKPDFMEVLADSARLSLREKLKQTAGIHTTENETPRAAPAFAYQDTASSEAVDAKFETKESSPRKKRFDLSNFALFTNVPDDEAKPAMTMENIRSAKAVFRDNNPSLRRPTMYLAGLCCVVAAMSFILRDPTALFGGKVTAKGSAVVVPVPGKNRPSTKVAKVLKHKQTQLNDKGTDAHTFTNDPAPKTKKPAKLALTAKKSPAKPARKPVLKHAVKKATVHHFTAKTKSKAHSATHSIHKKHTSTSTENTVKLYTPDTTPQSQEQK